MKCNFCLQDIREGEETKIIDHLVIHTNNATSVRPKTCEQQYRDYCQYIRRSA